MKNRIKTFEKVRNFRDFGSYKGAENASLRPDVLFRSAQFGEATAADMAQLDQLNIKVQADLRRPDERERQGLVWPRYGVKILSSDLGRANQAPHVQFMTEVSVDAEQAKQWMVDYYREAPYRGQHVETFRDWFVALSELKEDDAAVVNCAAGKDRTGILCALTHHILGVSRDDIFEDYLLTNQAVDADKRLPDMARRFNEHIGKNYPDEVYHPFIGVDEDFLSAAFDSIETQSGSVDLYLTETLNLDTKTRSDIIERLLI